MLRFSAAFRLAVDIPFVLVANLRAVRSCSSSGYIGILKYIKKIFAADKSFGLVLKYSQVSVSMLLYRGDSRANTSLGNSPTYFATTLNNAKLYGTVRSYEVKNNLNLFNMGSVNEVMRLMMAAPSNIHTDIVKTFNISNGTQVKRNSNVGPDRRVAQFICSLGQYDGYRAPQLLRKNGSSFHAEVVLCKPRSVLKNTKPVVVNLIPPRAPVKKRGLRLSSNN